MDHIVVLVACSGLLLLGGNLFWLVLLYHSRKQMQSTRQLVRECQLEILTLQASLRVQSRPGLVH